MSHVMIDTETLSVKPNGIILTLGAVKFNPYSIEEPADALYIKLDVDEQISLNRVIDEETVEWWGQQDPAIYEEATSESDRTSLHESTKQLNKFLVGVEYIWAQGIVFDIGMLENLYQQLKMPIPWQFWQIRDSRTIFSTFNDPRKEFLNDNAHNALADAYAQAKALQKVFKELGLHKQ